MKILKALTLSVISVSLLSGCVPDRPQPVEPTPVVTETEVKPQFPKPQTSKEDWIKIVKPYLLPQISSQLNDPEVKYILYGIADIVCDELARTSHSQVVTLITVAMALEQPIMYSHAIDEFVSMTEMFYC